MAFAPQQSFLRSRLGQGLAFYLCFAFALSARLAWGFYQSSVQWFTDFRGREKITLLRFVENAAQAIGETGGSFPVRIYIKRRPISFSVADSGPGIAADALPKVFETKRFGTERGLPTVTQIVVQHGGEVETSSEPRTGTRGPVPPAAVELEELAA